MPETLHDGQEFPEEGEVFDSPALHHQAAEARAVEERSPAVVNVIERAELLSRERGHDFVTTDDLFAALVLEPHCAAAAVLESLQVTGHDLVQSLVFILGRNATTRTTSNVTHSPKVQAALRFAAEEAGRRRAGRVETSHLLMALLRHRQGTAALLLETPGLGLEPVGAALNRALRENVADPS